MSALPINPRLLMVLSMSGGDIQAQRMANPAARMIEAAAQAPAAAGVTAEDTKEAKAEERELLGAEVRLAARLMSNSLAAEAEAALGTREAHRIVGTRVGLSPENWTAS